MSSITGSYDGEGSNVTGALAVAPPPDVAAGGPDPSKSGQGRSGMIPIDRRRRLRVSSEGARAAVAINVSGGDQILTSYARGVYVSAAGNIVGRLADDTADQTFANLVAGLYYPFCFALVRQTGTTATGVLLL
jgi:hypothetical protein